jgi:aspartyl aminopeptidase
MAKKNTTTVQRDSFVADLADFVTDSPTSWHAVEAVANRLADAGFARLDETGKWSKFRGNDAGFIVRDGAIVAWKAGKKVHAASPARVLGAHSDSPGFVVKPQPQFSVEGWEQVGVEVYGGPLLNSWLDRDLALAGRIVDRDGNEHLLRTEAVARIPQLAIHLDRGVNSGLELDPQRNTQPIIGVAGASYQDLVSQAAGVAADKIFGSEIRLVDTQEPARIGAHHELFASGRLDNLSSVYAGLEALVTTEPAADEIAVLAVFDHEEVGSATRAGADGPVLLDVLERLLSSLGADREALARSRARSWVLSADAGHAVHPNYTDKHDPNVRPLAGQGPILKVNAKQRYASDAFGEALWKPGV